MIHLVKKAGIVESFLQIDSCFSKKVCIFVSSVTKMFYAQ